ncbi:MAG: diguanylate cyclase [Calditrichaeota bacterium]|nr:diguanylate cyclase [Calditrichota bacterium]
MKNIKVLYIEDDPETRSLMADIMHYRGYQFFEADRGLQGIRLAKKIIPDLIIIDLLLPDMEGYEVTTMLKSIDEIKDKPIVALTAETRQDTKELTLAAGCDGFINKPINVNEFLFKIEEYLSGKRDRLSNEQEQKYLQKYAVQLVQKLSRKIIELESTNENLSKVNSELHLSKDELSRYNDRLFYLNNLANFLRKRERPENVFEILPQKTIEGFKVDRCVIFRVDQSESLLVPVYHAGFDSGYRVQKINISPILIEKLKDEDGLIWIRNAADVVTYRLEKFSKSFETTNFIISKLNDLAARRDATTVLKAVTEADQQHEILDKYIIFMDKGISEKVFATYEVRILKSFIQSVGSIYENMTLYHQLLETYKISERQAVTDELTGVYNYRYLMRELLREINRTQRFGMPFSVIMFDIDFFKNYNDRNGHPMGDEVLIQLSNLILNNTRKTDTVARYGGEEFFIILPGLEKKRAIAIAKKLRELVEHEYFPKQEHQPHGNFTISLGVSTFPDDSRDLKGLLEKVDTALYQAKHHGRNCIVISGKQNNMIQRPTV